MLDRYRAPGKETQARPATGDLLLSLALPSVVILLGIALSVGAAGGFDAFLAFCGSVIP